MELNKDGYMNICDPQSPVYYAVRPFWHGARRSAKNYDTFMTPETGPGSEEIYCADWHDVGLWVNKMFARKLEDIRISMRATDFCQLRHGDLAA